MPGTLHALLPSTSPPALGQSRTHFSPAPARFARWRIGRGSRVTILIIAILLASIADLALTLEFLTSVGMSEANPLARVVIGTGSLAIVVAFKLTLSFMACAILWFARKRSIGEAGAWVGMLIMAWLMIRWDVYIDHSHLFTAALHGKQHATDSCWVALGE